MVSKLDALISFPATIILYAKNIMLDQDPATSMVRISSHRMVTLLVCRGGLLLSTIFYYICNMILSYSYWVHLLKADNVLSD